MAIAEAHRSIDLKSIGLKGDLRLRRGMTGTLLWEVSGGKSAEKADALAAELRRVLVPMGIRVDRPNKKAEGSATCEEVVRAIAELGGCTFDAAKCHPHVIQLAGNRLGKISHRGSEEGRRGGEGTGGMGSGARRGARYSHPPMLPMLWAKPHGIGLHWGGRSAWRVLPLR